MVPWVLNSILSKYITSQNPHVRQAACIWLLSLVKKFSQHKEITVSVLYNSVPLNLKPNGVEFLVQCKIFQMFLLCLVFASVHTSFLGWEIKKDIVILCLYHFY